MIITKNETEKKTTYIHYGNNKFIPEYMKRKCNAIDNKPSFGLWASKTDADFGWKDWCMAEEYRNCDEANSFKFTLKESAKILHISGDGIPDVLKPYYISMDNWYKAIKNNPNAKRIDFDSIIADGYDAVEFEYSNTSTWNCREGRFNELYDLMYGWDCDSIVILNPDVVEEVK